MKASPSQMQANERECKGFKKSAVNVFALGPGARGGTRRELSTKSKDSARPRRVWGNLYAIAERPSVMR